MKLLYEKHNGIKDEKYFKRRRLIAKLNLIKRLRDWIYFRGFQKELLKESQGEI